VKVTTPPVSQSAVDPTERNWRHAPPNDEERRFLEGPRPRSMEAFFIGRVAWEFFKGFRALHFVGPCVTVFGSARFTEAHPEYQRTREVGRRLVEAGFSVMTGGGPGLMEAANRGAKEAGGLSLGSNIRLPLEERPNAYLDKWIEFRYFFVRKVMLTKYSYAFIAMPGGFGTLDEIFETATLVQTGKIRRFPIVLVGIDFWGPLMDHIRDTVMERFGLSYKTRPIRPRRAFWENDTLNRGNGRGPGRRLP
jgi:uncharacterized protein (TIGR00730 family)